MVEWEERRGDLLFLHRVYTHPDPRVVYYTGFIPVSTLHTRATHISLLASLRSFWLFIIRVVRPPSRPLPLGLV